MDRQHHARLPVRIAAGASLLPRRRAEDVTLAPGTCATTVYALGSQCGTIVPAAVSDPESHTFARIAARRTGSFTFRARTKYWRRSASSSSCGAR